MSDTNAAAMTRRQRTVGFTLVELLVTIAVVAVLLALAFPSFREITIRTNVTSVTNDLVGALNTARGEAVKRGMPVAVVSNSGSGTWTSGWQIEVDTARDGTYLPLTVIGQHAAVPATYSLFGKANGGNDGMAAFNSSGTLQPVAGFDFSVCRPAILVRLSVAWYVWSMRG